eukprot:TRINITY_DN12984_c0_g1_i1.p1 TRINITY_DN12984_c0_g1~~TRINITY_DN12984_c0_g1_i1.p1  ORF type:complete len:295 (-),score=56.23 TRINITY_DN12984_c0_g1_i1:42-827(-)
MDSPVELELFDGGAVPDQVGNDGMYARYFTGFDQDDRYSLKCQVEGTNETNINQGFIDAKRERSLPYRPSPTNPICCGSTATNEDSKLELTGKFSRTSIAGSFQVTGVPAEGANLYPPGTVRDLHLALVSEAVVMTFTAPGEDLDYGTASKYEVYYSKNKTELEDTEEIASTCVLVEEDDLLENTTLTTIPAGLPVEVKMNPTIFEESQQYFLRLHVEDFGNLSSWSNIATIFVAPTSSTTLASPSMSLFLLATFALYNLI